MHCHLAGVYIVQVSSTIYIAISETVSMSVILRSEIKRYFMIQFETSTKRRAINIKYLIVFSSKQIALK